MADSHHSALVHAVDQVALLCLLGLLGAAGAGNRSIDCAARPLSSADSHQPTTTTEQVKQLLQEMKDNCSYDINDRMRPDAVWACRKD